MYELLRNRNLLFSYLILLNLASCGSSEPKLPAKPVPTFPTPTPNPNLPTRPKPEPTPKPIESCVNGETYGIENKQYPGRGLHMVARCDGYKPLVVGNNGTGAPAMYYAATARHLASKGFRVIWPENPQTGNGKTCMEALEYGFRQADNYPGHYAITGHSQGGSASIVCAGLAEQKWPDYRAAILPNQPACGMNSGSISRLARLIDQKVLFFAGDRDTVVRESWVRQCYNYVKADKALVIGRGSTHFNTQNYIPELALGFFKGALLDQLDGWEILDRLDPRKYNWKENFEEI